VDERVLRAFAGRAGAATAYAACLATLAEYRLGRRAMALALGVLGRESDPSEEAGWGPRSELGRRVGRILRRGEGMKPLHAKLVLGGAMLGLLVAATGFERCPQVVGFSDGSVQHAARAGQWQPTHGDETAMNGAPRSVLDAEVYVSGGRKPTGRRVVEWAREAEARGAGEILLTSMDTDGMRGGFDCELTAAVSEAVQIPVIASGGAGSAQHFAEVFRRGKADAALAASIFHFGVTDSRELKGVLQRSGVSVRLPC
jgi:hypothetical protein